MVGTGIVILLVWGVFYFLVRKKLSSSKIYFIFVFAMLLPSILDFSYSEIGHKSFGLSIKLEYTFLLAILMAIGITPWIKADKYIKSRSGLEIYIPNSYVKIVRIIVLMLIIGSIMSMCYLGPYALKGMMMGAKEVRMNLAHGKSLLPSSIFTTLSVGFAALNIYNILFFFLSFICKELNRYRWWLLVASLSNVVSAIAFTGRDQIIVLLTFFIAFFLLFKPFISFDRLIGLRKSLKYIGLLALTVLISFSVSRFYNEKGTRSFMSGTLGYISEQPYVFNEYIEKQNKFHGFERRLPIINRITGNEEKEPVIDRSFEWRFGTMYAEFYSMYGWKSLFGVALVLWLYFYMAMDYLVRFRRFFGVLLLLTVFMYIQITGLFYFKVGATALINGFYIALSIIPLIVGNYVNVRVKGQKNV